MLVTFAPYGVVKVTSDGRADDRIITAPLECRIDLRDQEAIV
jgi:hypothetical protein